MLLVYEERTISEKKKQAEVELNKPFTYVCASADVLSFFSVLMSSLSFPPPGPGSRHPLLLITSSRLLMSPRAHVRSLPQGPFFYSDTNKSCDGWLWTLSGSLFCLTSLLLTEKTIKCFFNLVLFILPPNQDSGMADELL